MIVFLNLMYFGQGKTIIKKIQNFIVRLNIQLKMLQKKQSKFVLEAKLSTSYQIISMLQLPTIF